MLKRYAIREIASRLDREDLSAFLEKLEERVRGEEVGWRRL